MRYSLHNRLEMTCVRTNVHALTIIHIEYARDDDGDDDLMEFQPVLFGHVFVLRVIA